MSTFQMFNLQKYYTCGVVIVTSLLFSGTVFSNRSGFKSNQPYLITASHLSFYYQCHTNQVFHKDHENQTVTLIPPFPFTDGMKHLV